jgi:hypothetical protein
VKSIYIHNAESAYVIQSTKVHTYVKKKKRNKKKERDERKTKCEGTHIDVEYCHK